MSTVTEGHMGTSFSQQVIFVTGAAHGIGLATARAFAAEEAAVFLLDLDADRLRHARKEVAEQGSGRVVACPADVRSSSDVHSAVQACLSQLGRIDVLINHAGIGPSQHCLDITERDWRLVLDTNLSGVFRVARCVAEHMVTRNTGVILNMASSGAIATEPGHAHYAASKAGILALTQAMAQDLGPQGVRVCALCPGDVASHEWSNVELARLYRQRIVAGRSASPEEIAAVYLFLASEEARNINGAAFIVDGGMLAWE
jgi:3-oxoacyl-[acyl-carrier protein] reductase